MNQDDARAVECAEDERFAAMIALDYERLTQLYAADMTYVHGSAVVDDRDAYFAAMHAEKFVYRSWRVENRRVRFFGETAVVDGRYHVEMTSSGTARTLDNIAVSVWVRRDGRWQMVHWAATPVPRPTP
jgi:uncharacterized protein (TIGR02246 family)